MAQHSRAAARPARSRDATSQLLERLHGQFPELSHDEVALAAAGVAALPALEPVEPVRVFSAPPRYRA